MVKYDLRNGEMGLIHKRTIWYKIKKVETCNLHNLGVNKKKLEFFLPLEWMPPNLKKVKFKFRRQAVELTPTLFLERTHHQDILTSFN
jgi:hypothetical protein